MSNIGLFGLMFFVFLAWGIVLAFYIGMTIFRNRVLNWDESWRKEWEARSGKRIEHYKSELDASLNKWRAVSWISVVIALLLMAVGAVIPYFSYQQNLFNVEQTRHLLWMVILFAIAIPLPAFLIVNMAVNVIRRMILKVEDFIYADLRIEYDEKVRQLTELNEQRGVEHERWKTGKRAEIARRRAIMRQKTETRKKQKELEKKVQEDERQKKRMAIEEDLEREEILKKVEG